MGCGLGWVVFYGGFAFNGDGRAGFGVDVGIAFFFPVFFGTFKDHGVLVAFFATARLNGDVVVFATHFVGLWITAERWRILLRAQNIALGMGTITVTVLIGFFFSNFLPTTIGGDVYRIYDSSKRAKIPMEKAASVILVERFSGFSVNQTRNTKSWHTCFIGIFANFIKAGSIKNWSCKF